ncbi:MAG: hypothetical protein NXI32_12595 [bacterium]|nr:hypothetical protein [bacterium]
MSSTSLPFNAPAIAGLKRVFRDAFTVRDIAESLISFDDLTPAELVHEFMLEKNLTVVGIRNSGSVCGFITLENLSRGTTCGDGMQPLDASHVIHDSASLVDLVLSLRQQQRLFVTVLGQVGGIVSRTDLLKPPVRMWLFGMITLIEMRLTKLIERLCPDDSWQEFLSPARIEKANELLNERRRRLQELSLLDCLQLSDKTQIVARHPPLRNLTRFASRRSMEEATKRLEKLRNNLTHSQDIVSSDWEAIVSLAENLEDILEGPTG